MNFPEPCVVSVIILESGGASRLRYKPCGRVEFLIQYWYDIKQTNIYGKVQSWYLKSSFVTWYIVG